MRYAASAGLLLGLTLFVALLAWQGIGDILAVLAVAGWGLLLVAAYHLVPLTADALAWCRLFGRHAPPRLRILAAVRWLGESVNTLLPVAQIGGDVVRARVLALRGMPAGVAGASVVADVTLGVITQVAFTFLGLALLALVLGGGRTAWLLAGGALFMSLLVSGFVIAQRRGLFGKLAQRLERLPGLWALGLADGAHALDAQLLAVYRDTRAVAAATAWRLGGWLLGAGEVWLALYFLGMPVSWLEALLLESLGQAVRGAAFLVPAALGVQEGGYLLLGGMLGLGPDVSLALSLTKRVRELVLGLPGLIAWQAVEGRRLWRNAKQGMGSS